MGIVIFCNSAKQQENHTITPILTSLQGPSHSPLMSGNLGFARNDPPFQECMSFAWFLTLCTKKIWFTQILDFLPWDWNFEYMLSMTHPCLSSSWGTFVANSISHRMLGVVAGQLSVSHMISVRQVLFWWRQTLSHTPFSLVKYCLVFFHSRRS